MVFIFSLKLPAQKTKVAAAAENNHTIATMMNSGATILAAILIQSPSTALGWIPRFSGSSSTCNSSIRKSGCCFSRDAARSVILSAAGKSNDDNNIDDNNRLDKSADSDGDNNNDVLPLFSKKELKLRTSMLRLEAIFNDSEIDSDFFTAKDTTNKKDVLLNNGEERVVLGGWMDWESEGGLPECTGDSCGGDFDVS